jgi:ABC-2 type transport system permease protein
MQQASIGAGHIKNILTDRIRSFILRSDAKTELPLRLVVRKEFNPNGEASWFSAIVALINQITTLTVVLTGAALIREREHGTIEHLLTLPLTPFEIAISKVWADGLPLVSPVRSQDSSLLSPLAEADCLLIRPPNAPAAAPGSPVPILPLDF